MAYQTINIGGCHAIVKYDAAEGKCLIAGLRRVKELKAIFESNKDIASIDTGESDGVYFLQSFKRFSKIGTVGIDEVFF